jgi:carbonic anhydrase/acetyltransferase-like protein (isoleucine patch superfamily)
MDVRAVVIVGGSQNGGSENTHERFGGVPIALLDVLGIPVLDRVIDRLHAQGISAATVVGDLTQHRPGTRRAGVTYMHAVDGSLWRSAEAAFNDQAQAGAELVLVIRLGSYTELHYDHLIQFHLDQAARVTAVVDAQGVLLDRFVISASRRNDAAFLFRSELKQFRSGHTKYQYTGYCNRLKTTAGLRQLAIDAFAGDNEIKPAGNEIKPGVWVADNARVQRGARLLAPCFIGANAKVRAHAVITRCSAVERETCVDFGTVVENATVLPYTSLGAGLDIMHSVVGFRRIAHLVRSAEVEIDDTKLINAVSSAPHLRTLSHAASLAAFLPRQLVHGLTTRRKKPVSLPEAVRATSPALKQSTSTAERSEGEFDAPFMIARR